MPVVVSMLNSYSGLGGGGHRLLAQQPDADHRGLAGGPVRRDPQLHHVQGHEPAFLNVILGGFGGEASTAAGATQQRSVKSGSADDAAFVLGNAETVVIVPGYGLAVARPACGEGAGAEAHREGHHRQVRDPPVAAACRAT